MLPFPLIEIKEKKSFLEKVEQVKNATEMYEKFEVGYYQDGKMELGYFSEIDMMSPENGEVIEFSCKEQSFLTKIK